ncbi:MAG: hypothetical protein AB1730_08755 [Myxococcota bacterium]|jgi:hypothetical protein
MASARTTAAGPWRLAPLFAAVLAAPACNCGAYDATLDRIEAIVASDAGGGVDAGEADAGSADAGGVDAGEPDGGVVADAGTPPDAGAPDAGRADGGTFDA